MEAIAVPPPKRYSSESTVCASSQPEPVVVATMRTLRCKAPVRSSSLTTRSALACVVGADSSPA